MSYNAAEIAHWMGERHHEIHEKTNVNFCQPCRPNKTNIEIQNMSDSPHGAEDLYR